MVDALNPLFGYEGRVRIGEIELDASISEAHTLEAEVTEHTVEEGSDISDHYKVKPTPFRISGIVTNSPLLTGYPGKTFVNSIQSLEQGSTPVQDAWELANGYFRNKTVLDIHTSLQPYEGVVLLSFKVDRDAKTGRCLKFECVAKKLRTAKIQTVAAIKIPKKTAKAAETEKKKGKKPKKKPKRTQSMLAKAADFFKP